MLLRAGHSPKGLAQEFEPTAQSIRNWFGQAECDAGRRGNPATEHRCVGWFCFRHLWASLHR
jgi:hypothetical protein